MSDINLELDIGLFIRMIRSFQHLYDNQHKDFKNISLRKKTWAKISAALNISVDECLRIWKNFRDKYTRERRTITNTGKLPAWEFYEAMEFLNPYIKRRRSIWRYKKKAPISVATEYQDMDETSNNQSDSAEVKFAPEEIFMLENGLDDNTQIEEITLESMDDDELSNQSPSAEEQITPHRSSEKNVRRQTSEEAFGAYVASRLMDFPVDIRQIKKAKIFKALEDLGDF